MSLSQKMSKLRHDGAITDEEYKALKAEILTEEEIKAMLSPKPLTEEQEAEIREATKRFVEKFMAGEYKRAVPAHEPCVDAISREDAIKAMYGLCGDGSLKDNPWRDNPNIDAIVDALSDLPPVQTERQRGEWVINIHDWPICNQCGYMTPFDRAIDDYEYGNFCPSCGADMRKEEAE